MLLAVVFFGDRFLEVFIDFRVEQVDQLQNNISQRKVAELGQICTGESESFLVSLGEVTDSECSELLRESVSMVLFVLESVGDEGSFSFEHLSVGFVELGISLCQFVEDFVKGEGSLSLAAFDFETPVSVSFDVDKVLVKVPVVVPCPVQNSLQFPFVLLYFDHLESVFEKFVLLHVVQHVFVQSLQLGNYFVVDLLAFCQEVSARNVTQVELYLGFGSALTA